MTTIKSLRGIAFDSICHAFKEAFVDYEMQLEKEELRKMLQRRGFVSELSFAAFDGDQIVSFTLNGIGYLNDLKTAYDTGTGTIKEYRGQGLATQVFKYSEPVLRNAGVSQYLLEVLQHNKKAFSIYKNMGFEINREFNYFIQNKEDVIIKHSQNTDDFIYKRIELSQCKNSSSFCEFNSSWQNSFEAISRCINEFIILGAYKKTQLIGYCIFEPCSGDITQIAVDKDFRRKGIASSMLKQVLEFNQYHSIKVINADVACYSIDQFFASVSILQSGKQYEMIKRL